MRSRSALTAGTISLFWHILINACIGPGVDSDTRGCLAGGSHDDQGSMMSTDAKWQQLLREHPKGLSLPQPFYVDPAIFEAEIECFLARQWVFAGHASQIPDSGDYFVIEYLGASIIVVRDASGAINAVHNVCRHRGARLCEESSGRTSLLRCRYHGWSYRLNGDLAAWRHMPEGLAREDFGLRRCGVAVFEGTILISLDPAHAPDAEQMFRHVRGHWSRYDLAASKVAATREYLVHGNWKLGIENNLECYHCLPSHPEYSAANAFVKADEQVSAAAVDGFTRYQANWREAMSGQGTLTGRSEFLETGGQGCRAGTWPLAAGQLTASRDGQGVAPLLGTIQHYDESVTTGAIGFLSYLAVMCDYALMVVYLPQSVDTTKVVMRWLVRAEAQEGRDYQVPDLVWLWDETTKQDKGLIELNAAGVGSRGYQPGPYSRLETIAQDFIERYSRLMAGAE